MFGNDPKCRAPNSGRRKVWSSEGIKQPLQVLSRRFPQDFTFEPEVASFFYTRGSEEEVLVLVSDTETSFYQQCSLKDEISREP